MISQARDELGSFLEGKPVSPAKNVKTHANSKQSVTGRDSLMDTLAPIWSTGEAGSPTSSAMLASTMLNMSEHRLRSRYRDIWATTSPGGPKRTRGAVSIPLH